MPQDARRLILCLQDGVSGGQGRTHRNLWTYQLLELRHMHHRINFAAFGELQLVSHCANASNDRIGPIVSECQLLMRSLGHGRLHKRLKLEENRVTNSELPVRTVLIRLSLHAILSTLKLLLKVLHHHLPLLQP